MRTPIAALGLLLLAGALPAQAPHPHSGSTPPVAVGADRLFGE